MTRDKLLSNICPTDMTFDCWNGDKNFNCDDCNRVLEEWLYDYEKHVIEQYKADTGLNDTIKDIHDRVAQEMYCKGIDDFLTDICKMIVQSENNGNYRFYAVEIKQAIADLAEQLKAGGKNGPRRIS